MSENIVKENLSEATEFELRGMSIKVYPVAGPQLIQLNKSLQIFGKMTDFEEQINFMGDIIYNLIKEDNPEINKEALIKVLTIEASVKILKKAAGSFGNVASNI